MRGDKVNLSHVLAAHTEIIREQSRTYKLQTMRKLPREIKVMASAPFPEHKKDKALDPRIFISVSKSCEIRPILPLRER